MMKKISLVLIGIVLVLGMVSANHALSNVVGIDIPSGVVAGDRFEANFSFDYFVGGDNEEGSPLIIKLNILSDDEVNYPVWKGDFEISGRIEKSFFGIPMGSVEFDCNEEYTQVINHSLDSQEVVAEDGVFYCYSEEGDLDLNEHDDVYLEVRSDARIYPGEYEFSAELFYLTDERAPFVNITNKDLFDGYYRENDNVLVLASIFDGSEVLNKWASVTLSGLEIFPVNYDHFEDGEHYFSRNTPVDIAEGDYDLVVFAEDEFGNVGNDSVVLKIDRTGPEISLKDPISVSSDLLEFVVKVRDEKSGVDNESFRFRMREMNGSNVCPEDGVGSWDCYNSGWLSSDIVLNVDDFYFFTVRVNTTEVGLNGEYWLDMKALDFLGNEGRLD